jgi:tripartite-type tricarboxylate transporter receptor subunit TctC
MTTRRNSNETLCGVVLLALLMLVLAPATGAPAQTAKPFYEGKTIQLIVSTGTGATTDITARLVARYLGKYISGNPNIVAHNMPGGGGLVAANYIYNVSKPDGLTIVAVSRANYMEQLIGRPEVKTDFRKLSWLGSFNKTPMMIACRSDSPFKNLAAIKASKTPPRFGQSGTGSISYVFGRLVETIFDVKFKNVTGFKSARETDLGMERGEIDCRATSDLTVIRAPWNQWVKDKYVTFILQQGPEKSDLIPPVPTVYELAPPESKSAVDLMGIMLAFTEFDRPFAAPPALPPERLQILREAFLRMIKDKDFIGEGKKLLDWDGNSYLSGEQLQKKIETTMNQPADVVKRIKEILTES